MLFFALVAGCYAFLMPFAEPLGVRIFLVVLYTITVVALVVLDLWTRCA